MSDNTNTLGEVCPTLAAQMPDIERAFDKAGALAIVTVRAPALESLEHRYGAAAFTKSLSNLTAVIQSVCLEAFEREEPLAVGDLGQGEVHLILTRDPSEDDFFRNDLKLLARVIEQRVDRQRNKIAYPYSRQLPRFETGYAMVLRNPLRSATSQVREAVEAARDDAELATRNHRRRQRWRFLDVLLAGSVYSVYEPIVDAKTLTVFGYEALVRGKPDTEFASAPQLFGTAEEEGLLFELDCLCRHKAIEGAVDFPADAKLFMNIRPTSIHDPSFQPDAITRTLEQCGLSPSDVVFEISEQESIDNYEIFREARDEYGKLGFQFAIDDTGAGYASLEAVMELGPEFIKVDRAFNRGIDEDPARQNMVSAFKDLAARMNARIIGEGLDTLEELHMLGELGIHFGQGWLFGKPTPLRA